MTFKKNIARSTHNSQVHKHKKSTKKKKCCHDLKGLTNEIKRLERALCFFFFVSFSFLFKFFKEMCTERRLAEQGSVFIPMPPPPLPVQVLDV